MGRTLLWIVLALALGAAGWFVFGGSGEEGAGGYVDPEDLVELPVADDDVPGLKGTGTHAAGDTGGGGAFAIVGRVLTADGAPAADVPVVARHEGKATIPNDPASWTRTLDEAVQGVVDRLERAPGARRPVRASARTDADGRFRLSLAEAARYRVEVTPAAPAVCPYQTVSVHADEPTAERTFTLLEGAALHGTVVDENDTPIVATLHPTQSDMVEGVYRTWAGAPTTSAASDGSWRFDAVPRGTVRIAVHFDDGRRIPGISVEVPHDGPFVIRLPRGSAALSGTVTDAAGTAVANALVAVTVRWTVADQKGSTVLRARSDAAGAFAFADVPKGTVGFVEAVAEGFLPHREQLDKEGATPPQVGGGDGAAPTTIAVELKRGGAVHGRLTEAGSDTPIAGATIQLHRRRSAGQAMSFAIPPVTTDGDGRYRIEGVGEGAYVALPEAAGYYLPQLVGPPQSYVTPAGANNRAAPPELTVIMTAEGKEVVRDLVLGRGFDVHGIVVDDGGKGVAGAEVHAQGYGLQQVAWQWGIQGRNSPALATSGGDGRFTARGMPPRESWILYAKKEGHAGVHASAFALGAGTTPADLELKLRQGGVLRGRLEGLDAGALSETQVGFWGPQQELAFKSWGHKPKADGTFEITGVPAGDWTMNAWANGRQAPQQQVKGLKAGEVREGIVLTFAQGLAVSGRVVDSQGEPVARLNVMLQVKTGSWNQSVTNSEGRFRFPNVAEGSAQLMTWSDTGQQIPIGKRFDVPADDIEVVYDKPKTVYLRGEVQAADGTPIALCSVTVRASRSARGRAPMPYGGNQGGSDAINGRFELKSSGEGPWVISATNARGEDGKPLNLKTTRMTVKDPSEHIVLRMEAGVTVGGRVLDAAGKGIAGVSVTIGGRSGRTDKDGRFTIAGLTEGRLIVQVNPPTGLVRPKAQTARAGQTDLEFTLIAGKTIAGTALGPDGKPLTQGYANAMWDAQGEHAQGSSGAQVEAEGKFTIQGVPPGVRARVQVQVWSSSGTVAYAPAVVENVLAGTQDLEIRIGGGLTIQGRVLGHDGKAPGQCYVYGRTEDGKKQTGWVQIGEDGTFELGGLEPVPYTITVNRQDGGAAPPPVTVTPPRSGLEIRLPRTVSFGGRLEGLGTETGERWQIRVWTADGKQIATGRVNADGTWQLPSIAELDAVLVAATNTNDDRFARAGPVKSSDENVVLRLTRGKTITGTVEGAQRDGRVWAFVFAEGEDGWRTTGRITKDGTFTIRGLPDGPYTVKAQQYGANAKNTEVGGVQAGATGVALDLR